MWREHATTIPPPTGVQTFQERARTARALRALLRRRAQAPRRDQRSRSPGGSTSTTITPQRGQRAQAAWRSCLTRIRTASAATLWPQGN